MIYCKYLFVFIVLFNSSFIWTQNNYQNGTIKLIDGNQIVSLIEIPSSASDKKIGYKKSESSKEEFLRSDLIESLKVDINDTLSHEFVFGQFKVFDRKTEEFRLKPKKRWLCLSYNTTEMNVYSSSDNYHLNEQNKLIISADFSIEFYVGKNQEEEIVLAYKYGGGAKKSKYFIDSLSHYCNDIPELKNRILSREYSWHRIYEIAEAYSFYKK